jgi:hypothetical protein
MMYSVEKNIILIKIFGYLKDAPEREDLNNA